MKYTESFRELEIYKTAKQLSEDIFEITHSFPREEMDSRNSEALLKQGQSIGELPGANDFKIFSVLQKRVRQAVQGKDTDYRLQHSAYQLLNNWTPNPEIPITFKK